MKCNINGKWVSAALAVAFAAVMPVCAEEELVKLSDELAMPKSMNAKVGCEGDIPCIALQVPHSKGGYVSVGCGKSHKVANEDAITKLQEAVGRLGDKLVRFRVGDATFYGFYCKECGGYEGHTVAMGGFQALFVFPPKGRGLDAESLEILKKVVFLPQKGFGIDSAIRLYGPKSPMKAAVKFPVLKKMVEARPECVELIALLHDVAKEAGETAAAAWCEAELKRLDPEVYGTPTTSVPTFDFTCTQGNKITESLGLYRKFAKKTVSIPTGGAAAPASVTPAPSGDGNAVATQGGAVVLRPPQGNVAPNKTKTVMLPGGATMEMIWCPAGTYMMGRRADSPCKDSNDVCPQIKVTLTKGFWLGKYEVTQTQWKSVMGANPSDPESSGDDLPVNNMSWDDAASFAKKVGGGARLPTDAEWEYACKAGTDTVFHWGDTCNGTEANCNGKKPFGTDKKGPNIDHAVKVGSYAPNAWGFHDMAGNVAEWCSDRHKDYYITHPKELTDPKGGDSSVRYRTVRGGCFYSYWRAVDCRSVKRDLCPPDVTRAYVGFRLAMDDDGEGTVDTQNAVATQGGAVVLRPPQGNVAPNKTKTVTLPGGATMAMVWCPPGTFMMGTPASEADRESKETLHKVTLTKGFWLGKYEVTQAQWRSVMGANPSKNVGDDLPVENVSWEMCDEFCRKVGGKARFPTEAEWEYACRAGTTTAFYWGGALNGDKANCEGDHPYGTDVKGPSAGHTTKGGTYGENPWGLCDMSGNVEEWCYDWYDLLKADDAVDPKNETKAHFRIVRGGYWRGFASWCRSGRRGYGHPTAADDRRGFRMAMSE